MKFRRAFDALERRFRRSASADGRDGHGHKPGSKGSGTAVEIDPVFLARAYGDPADREVAAFLAALFAYGQVGAMCRTIAWILDQLGDSPHRAILDRRHLRPGWAGGFRYRFNTRADLVGLLDSAAEMIRRHGSLGQSLASCRSRGENPDSALTRWAAAMRSHACGLRQDPSAGLKFLLADPAKGGACKRWRLLLRWMVRPEDGIDMGIWDGLFRPADLIVPLDTHWIRIAGRLGITRRGTPDGRMAEEITEFLRWIRPRDPLRYDYAICHLGISGGCPPRLERRNCGLCLLHTVCGRQGD